MNYTKEFWKLPKKERINELKSRMKNRSTLNVKFNKQKQIGLNKEEINTTLQKLREQQGVQLLFSQTVGTSHDSQYVAYYLASSLVTSYCYEQGIDPSTLSFDMTDIREVKNVTTKRFLFISKKEYQEACFVANKKQFQPRIPRSLLRR